MLFRKGEAVPNWLTVEAGEFGCDTEIKEVWGGWLISPATDLHSNEYVMKFDAIPQFRGEIWISQIPGYWNGREPQSR